MADKGHKTQEQAELGVYICGAGREFTSLRSLLARALEAKTRVVVSSSEAEVEQLDKRLWLGADDNRTLLPHGRADGASATRQPILLVDEKAGAEQGEASNGAEVWLQYLGEGVLVPPVGRFSRTFVVTRDGALDEAEYEKWREAGYRVRLWRQEDGRWREVESP